MPGTSATDGSTIKQTAPARKPSLVARWWCRELTPLELEFRRQSVPVAIFLTLFVVVPGVVFYAVVAHRPHATIVEWAGVVVAVGSLVVLRLPWDGFVRSRRREAYFLGWWAADFAVIIAAAALDGGPRSPLLLIAFVQVVWTGLSFPRASIVLASLIALSAIAALDVLYSVPLGLSVLEGVAFVATGLMAYLGIVNHDRRIGALVASEQRLAEAQAIAHIGAWEWCEAGDRLTMSEELIRIFGASEYATTLGLDGYLCHVHPADREEVERALRRAVERAGQFSLEHRITRADGEVRSVVIHGNASGRPEMRLSGVCQDITELRVVQARLRHAADHDPLTGLLNRRRLVGEIDRHLGYGPRPVQDGALLLIDVDAFGFYNDSYGPRAGDALLRSLADALSARLRSSDIVARSGGDEFAVVLPDATEEFALAIGHELRALLGDCVDASISVSIGIAPFGPAFDLVGQDVLVAADVALHEAKQSGGNRVSVYKGQSGPDMNWVQRIRVALEHELFVLYSQPIIDLKTGGVTHRELLIRMRDDDGNIIAPVAFLPAAERFGLINAIDRWVLSAAVELAAAGQRVALNLSANSIGDPELLRIARAAVARGVDPALLIFEITETATIANLSEARDFAGQLTSIGCRLAIDDFGTGFGSLTYLKHIPSRYVKIDREFIRDLIRDPTDREVVAAVVGIARSLGKVTIAEGVEDEPTLQAIRELGVDYVQGFYTGRPQPLASPAVAEAAVCRPAPPDTKAA